MTYAAAGGASGATVGAVVGGAGGTLVLPGVGAVGVAVGVGIAGGLVGTGGGYLLGTAVDARNEVTVEMGRLSRAVGKYILIGLGILNPDGPNAVPQDVRRVKKRDAPIEQEATPEKPRGAGEPPKKRQPEEPQ